MKEVIMISASKVIMICVVDLPSFSILHGVEELYEIES